MLRTREIKYNIKNGADMAPFLHFKEEMRADKQLPFGCGSDCPLQSLQYIVFYIVFR